MTPDIKRKNGLPDQALESGEWNWNWRVAMWKTSGECGSKIDQHKLEKKKYGQMWRRRNESWEKKRVGIGEDKKLGPAVP